MNRRSYASGSLGDTQSYTFAFEESDNPCPEDKGWLIDLGFVQDEANPCSVTLDISCLTLGKDSVGKKFDGINTTANNRKIYLPYPSVQIKATAHDGGGGGTVVIKATGSLVSFHDVPQTGVLRNVYGHEQVTLAGTPAAAVVGVPNGATAVRVVPALTTNGTGTIEYAGFEPANLGVWAIVPGTRPQAFRANYESVPLIGSNDETIKITGTLTDVWTVIFEHDLWS